MKDRDWIKKRTEYIKYTAPFIILSVIFYFKNVIVFKILLSILVFLIILNIIYPKGLIPIKYFLEMVLKLIKLLFTFFMIILLHFIVFPLIKCAGFLFKKKFMNTMFNDENTKTYYEDYEDDYMKNIKEPF